MRQADRHATGPGALSPLLAGTLALLALAAAAGEAAAQAGAALDHWRHPPPLDPLTLVLQLADGRTHWPPAGTPLLVGAAVACPLIVTIAAVLLLRRPARSADRAARLLGTGRSVHPVSLANARATAERFGVAAAWVTDRARRGGRPNAVRDLGGHAVRHLGATQRQVQLARDPDGAGRARCRVRDLEQARPVRGHPGGTRAARAHLEFRSRGDRGGRA